ncbi:putative AAA domain-containing protein ycf46 [Orchesella cincta]|uniref:Putative AAA domain-containing protein ycf46 n=1 Tax=Orchesella cincta TaxID=48709 RepID=A0A1D2NCF7_ORCCI|nr:putative AAA domain-containing protein ycf46 [Orchesella cincta]
MSGKKQKIVPGWFECSKCKKRLSRQLATKHSGDEETGCRSVYPYLKKNELFCVLNNVTSTTRKIGELPFVKDKRLSSSTIFISEELIKECDLTTFGWISLTPMVCSEEVMNVSRMDDGLNASLSICDIPSSNYAFRVWPLPESIGSNQNNLLTVLTMDGFGVNKLTPSNPKLDGSGDAPNGLVSIQKLSLSVKPVQQVFAVAKEVTIVIENFNEVDPVSFEMDRFVISCRKIFQGRPIALNNRFKIRFYAQFLHVHVSKIMRKFEDNETFGLDNLSLKDDTLRNAFAQIVSSTEINVSTGNSDSADASEKPSAPSGTIDNVGGMPVLLKEICATSHFILNTALDVPKGILLYGHTGVGKSLVAEAIKNEFKLHGVFYEEL